MGVILSAVLIFAGIIASYGGLMWLARPTGHRASVLPGDAAHEQLLAEIKADFVRGSMTLDQFEREIGAQLTAKDRHG